MKVVALAASTGGPQALTRLLSALPAGLPAALVMVQHLPPQFVAPFAERLTAATPWPVRVARDGEALAPGRAFLAPGGVHLTIGAAEPPGDGWRVVLIPGPPIGGHRPSADPLFASVAAVCGSRGIGVVLTGMGSDGAEGLLELRRAGGLTLGEAEETCVVFGMPRAAWEKGALVRLLPLPELAEALRTAIRAP